jgi:hypothetical protein
MTKEKAGEKARLANESTNSRVHPTQLESVAAHSSRYDARAIKQALTLDRFADLLEDLGAEVSRRTRRASCAAHGGDNPEAFSYREEDGGVVWYCFTADHGGDVFDLVREAEGIGFPAAIVWLGDWLGIPPDDTDRQPARTVVKTTRFEIRDEAGLLKAIHVRKDFSNGEKSFIWERDGKPTLGDLKPADLPLYGSETLTSAPPETPVYLTEGENAADALRAHGFLAVASVTGAKGTPRAMALSVLQHRNVILSPDHDGVGKAHMTRIGSALVGVAARIRLVELGREDGEDAADFFGRGGTAAELSALSDAAPAWMPTASEGSDDEEDFNSSPTVYSISEFLAQQDEEVPSLVGEGVIASGTVNILGGEDGVGKTMLALNLAFHCAAGRDFLGLSVPRALRVLFLEAEGNRKLFQERIATAADNLGIPIEGLPIFLARRPDQFQIGGKELRRTLEQIQPDLIIFDTIGYFYDGDENSNTDWKRFVSKPLRILARDYGTAFFLIQHLGKPNEIREGKHRIRGGSAQSGDSDTTLTLEKSKTRPETDRVLKFEKIKNGPRREPSVLHFDEGKALFTLTDADAVAALKPKLVEVQRIVLEAAGPLKKAELKLMVMEQLGVKDTAADDWISRAYRAGLISKPKHGYYGPPPGLLELADHLSGPGIRNPENPPTHTGVGNPGFRDSAHVSITQPQSTPEAEVEYL